VRRVLVPLAAAAALAACGPIRSGRATRAATADVAEARAAGAERLAPYWFTLAVEYLEKAREESAEADHQAASRLGDQASAAARRATAEARGAKRR
jgi:hypothetical protein